MVCKIKFTNNLSYNNMDNLMEDRIEQKLDGIRDDINGLCVKVDKLQVIDITNGGGRHVKYERDEFFQLLYDRPREIFTGLASFSEKALKILKFLAWISVIIYAAKNTFS